MSVVLQHNKRVCDFDYFGDYNISCIFELYFQKSINNNRELNLKKFNWNSWCRWQNNI